MKIITFIIRLGGLYFLYQGIFAVVQLHGRQELQAAANGGAVSQLEGVAAALYVQAWAAALVGLVAVLFAGRLARLLTFDAGVDE